jgi:elongation factor P--(R)-beta-lysine ligase
VFRNGEAGGRHNPEFTMLEWYRIGWDHRRLMHEVAELVLAALALVGGSARVRETSYQQLFVDLLRIDPLCDEEQALREPLQEFAIDPQGLRRDDWLDLLLTHRIQPQIARDELLIVHDYPASQCALAKLRQSEPPVAERFEVYLGPVELANGYHELTDAAEQRSRFERDLGLRASRRATLPRMDENLLSALQCGLPDCAGVALGVDRLLGVMLGSEQISAALAFPFAGA